LDNILPPTPSSTYSIWALLGRFKPKGYRPLRLVLVAPSRTIVLVAPSRTLFLKPPKVEALEVYIY